MLPLLRLPQPTATPMDEKTPQWVAEPVPGYGLRPPEVPRDPMEFLSRSWSASALAVSKALAPVPPPAPGTGTIPEEEPEEPAAVVGNPFSFASSATTQMVIERIMSQPEVSPLTSGRLSHSSGPLNGGGSLSDSPPVSPCEMEELKQQYCRASNTPNPQHYIGGSKTVGKWLKDRRMRKKEESRAQNAQLHAAISVASVAAAVAAVAAAAVAAAAAALSGHGNDDGRTARIDMAVASAATLVAAQCVEAAEAMGAEREHLASVVGSAVSVRTPGDIVTLTAAAATALRGAATLKARALKDVWNIAAVIPVEKGTARNHNNSHGDKQHDELNKNGRGFGDEFIPEEDNFLGLCSQEFLAQGTELLKRTRKGALHWKTVSVYINRVGQVMLKMKSKHVAGTITKKKKNVVIEVCKDVQAWPGRHLLAGGEWRRHFGLRTAEHRVIEFECLSPREHEIWTQGILRLLIIASEKKKLSGLS